jgi:Tfp pilus assembly protein PilF
MLKWIASRLKPVGRCSSPLDEAQALRVRGNFDAARQICLDLLREEPERHAGAMALLAMIAADQRQLDAGMQWVERALAADRSCVPAWFARGRLFEVAQRYPEAEASYRQATVLEPGHAKAHTNLGCMLHIQGRLDEAVECYRKALELEPGQPEALRNYALIAGSPQQLREAVSGFERHLASHPHDASAQHQLANLYFGLGRHDDALAGYERAIALAPEEPEFHFARAQLLLLQGRYPEGWQEYEWRWRMERYNEPMRRFAQPCWDGRPLKGTLLVHGETGLGDTLLLVRYAALAARLCERVVVESQPPLRALVAGVEGVAQAVDQGAPLPEFQAHIPLIAFPGVFATTIDSIPWQGPYVHAEPARLRAWAGLVAASGPRRRKVGLVWTGNPENLANRERSVTLQHFAPLARAGGVTFFSLQKGMTAAQRGPVPEGMHFVDLTDSIRDFSDTAALLAQLDLMITVDTSVLHLAGAMGRPTWALLPFSPPWLYPVGRRENPWYPGMRMFLQQSEGDWQPPLQELTQALMDWVAPARAPSGPP